MARYTGPKNRLSRQEGYDIGSKTVGSKAHASLLRRINISPGVHGQKRKRKISEYAKQLREKQKVKKIYGVLEKQFKKYFQQALERKGITGENLLRILETRLDNVVYRLNYAPTRPAARQFVRHGHFKVNNRTVNIPSFLVKKDDVLTLTQKAVKIPLIAKLLEDKNALLPKWLEKKAGAAKVLSLPLREEIGGDLQEQLIVEYYSR